MQTKTDTLGLSAKRNKTPWRFAPTVKPKKIAATAGFAVIYGLLLAPLPRMESQPYGGTGTTRSSTDCSPPPSLSFPWLDDHMDASVKEDLFCALWNGEAVTIAIGIEFPADSDLGVGYYVFEVASWDDLVNTGIKLNDMDTAFIFFERKVKRKKSIKNACMAACLVAYEAAAFYCLKLTAMPAVLACEAGVFATYLVCLYNCKAHYDDAVGDLSDELEEKIIALTS